MASTKKLLICTFIILALSLFAGMLPIHGESEIYDTVVRLHVIANSDTDEDQALKLQVRDEVIAAVTPAVEGCINQSEAIGEIEKIIPEIEARAAATAPLKEHVWVRRNDTVEQIVKPQRVSVRKLGLSLRFSAHRIEFCSVSVEVPLYVFDVVASKDLVYRFHNVITDVLSGEIQQELVTGIAVRTVGGAYGIIGMCPIEIGILADHLGLEPKSELHAKAVDVLNKLCKSPLHFRGVYHPVAETRAVVIPLSEPTVVKDEGVNARALNGFCHCL